MRILFLLVLFLFVQFAIAQEPPVKDTITLKDTSLIQVGDSVHAEHPDSIGWKIETSFDLKFTQVSLHNWASGGQSSVAFNTAFSFSADYIKKHITWTNRFDADFGFFNQAKSPYWAKSDDRIELNSLFGRTAWKHWEYETFLTFRSQFTAGYSNPLDPDSLKITVSNFLAPGYIGSGIGIDYKPNENFNILIAPISSKITVVNNQLLADQGAFGVPNLKDSLGNGIPGSGKKIRREFGGTFKIMYKSQITEDFDIHFQLDLFSNYNKNPQNIDVNWEVILNWRLNKFLTVSINTLLIYDDDVKITRVINEVDPSTGLKKTKTGPITQFREISGLGFNFRF